MNDGFWGKYALARNTSIHRTAAALGVERNSLYRHLRGVRSFSPSTIQRLCRHWHISRRTLQRAMADYQAATGNPCRTGHGNFPHCRGCPHLAAAAARQPSTPNQ